MSKENRKCKVCGRIITDKKNITGLCPKHQKGLNDGAVVASGVDIYWYKKIGSENP